MATPLQVARRWRIVEYCNRSDFLVLYGLADLG